MSSRSDPPAAPVRRSAAAARATSRDLRQRTQAALDRAELIVQCSGQLLVAAERLQEAAVVQSRAHALFDIGDLTATHGVTLCGRLAGEEVGLVPALTWQDIDARYRCDECTAQAASV